MKTRSSHPPPPRRGPCRAGPGCAGPVSTMPHFEAEPRRATARPRPQPCRYSPTLPNRTLWKTKTLTRFEALMSHAWRGVPSAYILGRPPTSSTSTSKTRRPPAPSAAPEEPRPWSKKRCAGRAQTAKVRAADAVEFRCRDIVPRRTHRRAWRGRCPTRPLSPRERSIEASDVAQRNAARHGMQERIAFLHAHGHTSSLHLTALDARRCQPARRDPYNLASRQLQSILVLLRAVHGAARVRRWPPTSSVLLAEVHEHLRRHRGSSCGDWLLRGR